LAISYPINLTGYILSLIFIEIFLLLFCIFPICEVFDYLQFLNCTHDFYLSIELLSWTTVQQLKQDILTRPSLHRTAWHDWLDAGYVLTWGYLDAKNVILLTKIPFAIALIKLINNPEWRNLYFSQSLLLINCYFSIAVGFLIKYLLNLIKWR